MNANGFENICFNANRAAWEFTTGLKCYFAYSNGRNHASFVKLYDRTEVDALNAQVNNLHQENADKNVELESVNQKTSELEKKLADCRNRSLSIVTDTITDNRKILKSVVTFRQGSISVESS